jgi:hypothetical protein
MKKFSKFSSNDYLQLSCSSSIPSFILSINLFSFLQALKGSNIQAAASNPHLSFFSYQLIPKQFVIQKQDESQNQKLKQVVKAIGAVFQSISTEAASLLSTFKASTRQNFKIFRSFFSEKKEHLLGLN